MRQRDTDSSIFLRDDEKINGIPRGARVSRQQRIPVAFSAPPTRESPESPDVNDNTYKLNRFNKIPLLPSGAVPLGFGARK